MIDVIGLHLRSTEEPTSRMTAEGTVVSTPPSQQQQQQGSETGAHRHFHRHCYDPEYSRMEAWLDEHPDFVQDYFLRYIKLEIYFI